MGDGWRESEERGAGSGGSSEREGEVGSKSREREAGQ